MISRFVGYCWFFFLEQKKKKRKMAGCCWMKEEKRWNERVGEGEMGGLFKILADGSKSQKHEESGRGKERNKVKTISQK